METNATHPTPEMTRDRETSISNSMRNSTLTGNPPEGALWKKERSKAHSAAPPQSQPGILNEIRVIRANP